MIPILFGNGAKTFATNGIGRLTDAVSCRVIEQRNGSFTLEMEYLANGANYDKLVNGNIVVADANHKLKRQAFEIYNITKPINNIVTVSANHICYRQSYIPIKPFTATGITNTLLGFQENAMEDNPFTFTNDLNNEDSIYMQNTPKSLRGCLGGTQGSVLDTFSGSSGVEYEFDNFNTFITLHRGSNNGVQLRYGKNITDLEQNESIETVITGVVPYWYNEEQNIALVGDAQYNESVIDDYTYHRTELLDLSGEFTTTPSIEELNQAGLNYVTSGSVGLPKTNIKISFIEAPNVFGSVEIFESVNLCDVVKVVYTPLGIVFDSKVIETDFDVLRERYNSIEIGDARSDIGKTISNTIGDISKLNLSTQRVISITQRIDDEIGLINTTVGQISNVVGDENSGLVKQVQTNTTNIEQKVDSITLSAYQEIVGKQIGDLEDSVETIQTQVSVTTEGLKIKQNDEGSYFLITDTDAQVYVDGIKSAVFGANGTDTTELTLDSVWHQDTVNNGNTYILYYLEDE